MDRKPPMTEEEMARSVRRGIIFNATAFGILVILLLCSGIVLRKHQLDHTFTTERWLSNPDRRSLMLDDLMADHSLVGMSREEIIALLGPGDRETASFSGKLKGEQQGDLFIYHLGVDFMENQWLILLWKDNRVIDVVYDVT